MPQAAQRLSIVNGNVVLPDRVVANAAVVCEAGRIVEIASDASADRSGEVIDAGGGFVCPGFIDIHVHGGDGADYMDGTLEAVRTANRAHARHGTTTIFPTTTTGLPSQVGEMIMACVTLKNSWSHQDGARIGGVHLYGPYFAADKVGCHDPAGRRNPVKDEYEKYFKAGIVRIATCAAELPGAADFYKAAAEAGCLITCGHSNATWDEMQAAFNHGMRHVDHFWCAMSSVASLRDRCGCPMEAGMEQFVLATPEMSTEIIADGQHLSPQLMQFALKLIGPDRLILVTDCNRALDMPNGEYRFGHRETGSMFESNGRVGHEVGNPAALASSVNGMNHMVRTLVQSAGAAVHDAVRMASLTVAKRLGIDRHVGSIEPGKQADFFIADQHWQPTETIIAGKVFE